MTTDAKWTRFVRSWRELYWAIYDFSRQWSGRHHSWCTCGKPPCDNA